MKYLIVYTSETGTTKKCATMLKEKLRNSTSVDLNDKMPSLENYDLVIIGTPIRMGQINKKIKKFLKDNEKILLTKKTAYFICCAFEKDKEAYFTANFNPNLLKHALIYDCFGGELDLNNLHGFSKLIAKLATKNNKKPIKLNTENITKFIEKIT